MMPGMGAGEGADASGGRGLGGAGDFHEPTGPRGAGGPRRRHAATERPCGGVPRSGGPVSWAGGPDDTGERVALRAGAG